MEGPGCTSRPSHLATRLAGLVSKYRILLRLRRQREACERQGVVRLMGVAAKRRRRAAGRVAQAFPGCLRELELPAQALRRRLLMARRALVLAQAQPHRCWPRASLMCLILRYHALWRLGLAWRRSRRRALALPGAVCYDPHLAGRGSLWLAGLPKRGLRDAVWDELACQTGVGAPRLRARLFGET